jgi:AcrR family transcriptional regulator
VGTVSLREQNRERTREVLVATAMKLFRERGYGSVTIDEIAARAGVGRRTVFRYFATKEDLVLFDHADYVALFRQVLAQRSAKDRPVESLRKAAVAVARALVDHRAHLLPRLRLVAKEPALTARYVELDQRWHEAILELLAPRAPDPSAELRLRLFAGATVGALNAGLALWVRGGGKLDLVEATHTVFRLLENGLGGVEIV